MAFWDRLFGPPSEVKKRGAPRGPRVRKSAQEREKELQVRFLRDLRQYDPVKYHLIMSRRLGYSDERPDEIEQLEKTVSRLKKMGVIKTPHDLDDNSWIKDAVAGLGMFFTHMQQVDAQKAAMAAGMHHQYAPAPPALPPAPATGESEPPQEAPVSLISRYVISQLDGKSPEEAAEWLMSQAHPQAQEFVKRLIATPNDQLFILLDAVRQNVPDLAALVAWLRQRPDWLVATVQAIRRASAKNPEATSGTPVLL